MRFDDTKEEDYTDIKTNMRHMQGVREKNFSSSSHIVHGSDDHILWNLSSFHCDPLMQVCEVSWLSEEHFAFEVTTDKKVKRS